MNNSIKKAKDMKKHTYRKCRNMKYMAVEKCEDAVEKVKSGIEFLQKQFQKALNDFANFVSMVVPLWVNAISGFYTKASGQV